MRYLVYLITLLFSTAVAQNPTILQGNYVSNVFGQANFVLNPNAQSSTTNVTLTNATATRSTTTPLVATTEFNVTITSANGTATWATRSFDAGMKNQNCEARFTYRGFQATSKAQIKQGANVVAELTLTPSATDPRIASINFPCGDLSAATTFVITDSATLSGTNEIGGIYVGLATNQANVAQAEVVVRAVKTSSQIISASTNTKVDYGGAVLNVDNHFDPTTSTFTAKKAGCYKFEATVHSTFQSWQAGAQHLLFIIFNGDVNVRLNSDRRFVGTTITMQAGNTVVASGCFSVGQTAEVYYFHTRTTNAQIDSSASYTRLTITRFPSSSELVVTPETQNVWGGVEYTNQNQSLFSGVADPTAFTAYTNSTWNQPTLLKGKAQVSTTNSGNDLGFSIPNLPVGSYKISLSGGINSIAIGASTQASCNFRIRETTLNQEVVKYSHFDSRDSSNINSRDLITAANGVFENTSVATRNFILEANKRYDTSSGNLGVCEVFSANNPGTASAGNTKISIILTPIDNDSNSALYVQGPVKGSGTGAAIPAGYVGEFSTRSISDTVLRKQLTPGSLTFYYPWTGTLTLPSGNWMLCYKILAEVYQNTSTASSYIRSHVQNQTDSTEVMRNAFLPPFVPGTSQAYLWSNMAQCKPIAITSSKTFRVGIAWGISSGSPTVNHISIRGDLSASELYAIRLN